MQLKLIRLLNSLDSNSLENKSVGYNLINRTMLAKACTTNTNARPHLSRKHQTSHQSAGFLYNLPRGILVLEMLTCYELYAVVL
nr:hypothetical protein BgiMline_027301 [Biomphalaria glabrata]